jgi:hypothetical protein
VYYYRFSDITIRMEHTVVRSDDAIGTCCCHLITTARLDPFVLTDPDPHSCRGEQTCRGLLIGNGTGTGTTIARPAHTDAMPLCSFVRRLNSAAACMHGRVEIKVTLQRPIVHRWMDG